MIREKVMLFIEMRDIKEVILREERRSLVGRVELEDFVRVLFEGVVVVRKVK